MKLLKLQRISRINGTINLPGSKSISNRILLLASLANGTTIINNLLDSDDVRYMLDALKKLGIRYNLSIDRSYCKIFGNDGLFNVIKNQELFLGNAGIVMRSLVAILSLKYGKGLITLTGEPRMKERPIGHLVSSLRQGKAKIKYLEKEHYPPLLLSGGFRGGEIILDGSISSQFLTALLIAAPLASEDTFIKIKGNLVSKPYIDITIHLMKVFGIEVKNQLYQYFIIAGRQKYHSPGYYKVEGDASSASYFLAAAAIKGGLIKINNIGYKSIQGDIKFTNVLEKMGAKVIWGDYYIVCARGKLNAIDMDMNHIPDTAMTIAMVALFAKGTTIIRNIYNWRVKETDRILAMTTELRKLGAIVKEYKDYICITPPVKFLSAEINSYNDHRIAMCFSLAALADISITILNPKCITKTFPGYFKQLSNVSF